MYTCIPCHTFVPIQNQNIYFSLVSVFVNSLFRIVYWLLNVQRQISCAYSGWSVFRRLKVKESEWVLFNRASEQLQLYHGENKLFIMVRTSCLSWWEQVVYHGENKLFIMVRTRCLSVRWWCWLCARPTRLVGFLLWTNSLWADMSLQSDTWFWFRTNQSLLQLLTP